MIRLLKKEVPWLLGCFLAFALYLAGGLLLTVGGSEWIPLDWLALGLWFGGLWLFVRALGVRVPLPAVWRRFRARDWFPWVLVRSRYLERLEADHAALSGFRIVIRHPRGLTLVDMSVSCAREKERFEGRAGNCFEFKVQPPPDKKVRVIDCNGRQLKVRRVDCRCENEIGVELDAF